MVLLNPNWSLGMDAYIPHKTMYVTIYTHGNNYIITYAKLHWGEFYRYLLSPVLNSIPAWSNVEFYNSLLNQMNDGHQSVARVQRREWLELKLLH